MGAVMPLHGETTVTVTCDGNKPITYSILKEVVLIIILLGDG